MIVKNIFDLYINNYLYLYYQNLKLNFKIKNMAKKLGYGKREETSKIHEEIVNEFEEMKIKNNGKNIKISLDFLAKKYGYSCGQSVRNMINNFQKKQYGIN